MRVRLLAAVAALAVATVAGAQDGTQTGAKWDYVGKYGPVNWGRLDPAYKACSSGHEQSPIDIRGARLNKALTPIEYHYMSSAITLVNDGRTIYGKVPPGSYIVVDGIRYDLEQFHFHHPSEEAVKGTLSDMEVQLDHRSADGKLAVISIRLNVDRGFPNPVLATLWTNLPTTAGQTTKITDMVNPGGLLPADRGYWTYEGSLAMPPCTEGVRWLVLQQDMSISREQLRAFAAIFKVNARPLQDPHGRKITANQ